MKRILSIDGGGIRGLIPAIVCQRLEALSRKPVRQLFDLIAGTSTGGILALALAKLHGPSATDLVEFYKIQGPLIFSHPRKLFHWVKGPKYKNENLEKVMLEQFHFAKMSDAEQEVLITAYDIRQRRPVYFTKPHGPHEFNKDYYMKDIAVGTSAAPTYFAPVEIGPHVVIDGGLVANNPAAAAYAYAKELWPDEEILIVSLGTGTLTTFIDPAEAASWGKIRWAETVIDCALDGNAKATEDFLIRTHLRHFLRFQDGLSEATEKFDANSQKALAELQQVGERIITTRKRELTELVDALQRAGIRLSAQILSPQKEGTVPSGWCTVSGSITGYTAERLHLFTGNGGRYWPSKRIKPLNEYWEGDVHLGTTSLEATITLAAVDQRLSEYIELYRSCASAINYSGINIAEFPKELSKIHVIVNVLDQRADR
jgi:predicted acylesterase/phospholipase RssA